MPNPTVLLASSTSLLHLMPIQQCGKRTESFDSFGRRGAESSRWVAKGLPQDSLVVGKQVEPGSGACINRPMGCRQQSRTDKGLLMVPATSFQMLQKLSHFLKAAPVWAGLSGPTAGNHTEKWISRRSPQGAKPSLVPTRPTRGQGHQQCSSAWLRAFMLSSGTASTLQKSHRRKLEVLWITSQIWPARFLCQKRRKTKPQQTSLCSQSPPLKTMKDWNQDKSDLPSSFSLL